MRRAFFSFLVTMALVAGLPLAGRAGALAAPGTTPAATEAVQDVTLKQAAAAGIVKLSGKGGFTGDQVKVELDGKHIPGVPIRFTLHIEFSGKNSAGKPWPAGKAAEIAKGIEGRLAGTKAADGSPLIFDVDARVRTGTPDSGGTPGYHQIELHDWVAGTQTNFIKGVPAGTPFDTVRTGEWGANEPAGRWAHEMLHILGLKDRYDARSPVLVVGGKEYPLPKFSGSTSNKAAMDAWWDKVLARQKELEKELGKKGEIEPGVADHGDIMADAANPAAKIRPPDIAALVKHAGVHLHANPGDLLLNKDGTEQSFGVGAPLDLTAPPGGKATANGLYVYCIDHEKGIPSLGTVFDVLGPAKDQPGANLAALQRALEEIGRRQTPGGYPPTGAQGAVWVITDQDSDSAYPEAQAILAAAGLSTEPSAYPGTPHFANPNAGNPVTAAVTTTGVLPTVRTVPQPPSGARFGKPQPTILSYAALNPAKLRAGRKSRTQLRMFLIGGTDELRLAMQLKKGRKWLALRTFKPRSLVVAGQPTAVTLRLPKLKAGTYRLVITGTTAKRIVPIKVQRARR